MASLSALWNYIVGDSMANGSTRIALGWVMAIMFFVSCSSFSSFLFLFPSVLFLSFLLQNLNSPRDATVLEVRYEAGATVDGGAILVTFVTKEP